MSQTTQNMLSVATAYRNAGLSVLPILPECKLPACKHWKPWQEVCMSDQEIQTHFAQCQRIGVIGGEVSGGLEIIDFDLEGIEYAGWSAIIQEASPGLLDKLVIELTVRKGYHVAYRAGNAGHNAKL
jgi:hypothetical protein